MPSTLAGHTTFKIYRDQPSVSISHSNSQKPTSTSATRRTIHVATATDKENIDPTTGLPPRISSHFSKKRKGDALATKILAIKEIHLSPKKRRIAASGWTSNSTAADLRRSTCPRRGAVTQNSHRRQPSDLVSVVEEEEGNDGERVSSPPGDEPIKLPPELVDARCYELTVLPLADISAAFDCISSDEDSASSTAPSRIQSAATTPTTTPPASPKRKRTNTAPVFGTEDFSLDTPERKRIYSAFTFSSPFAAAQQRAASRASSKHPFTDILLDSFSHTP